jgi:hypothetical protein
MGSEIESAAVGRRAGLRPVGLPYSRSGRMRSQRGSLAKTLSPFHSVAVSRTLESRNWGSNARVLSKWLLHLSMISPRLGESKS